MNLLNLKTTENSIYDDGNYRKSIVYSSDITIESDIEYGYVINFPSNNPSFTDDYTRFVSINDLSGWNSLFQYDVTIECKIKPATLSRPIHIWQLGSDLDHRTNLYFHDGILTFWSGSILLQSSIFVQIDLWSTITIKRRALDGMTWMYINSILGASGLTNPYDSPTASFIIGNQPYPDPSNFIDTFEGQISTFIISRGLYNESFGTGIRFPADLPLPLKDGYSTEFENTRLRMAMETGAFRQRRNRRKAPRLFDLKWEFSQSQFTEFDKWWQDTIKGGALAFDVQVLDDDAGIVWYTVMPVGGQYKNEVLDHFSENWAVTMRVRALADSFIDRPVGTDELHGISTPSVLATGEMLIGVALSGQCDIDVVNTGKFDPGPIYGFSNPNVNARARLGIVPIKGSASIVNTNVGLMYMAGSSTINTDNTGDLELPGLNGFNLNDMVDTGQL